MTICPACGSRSTARRRRAQTWLGVLGALAGVVCGASGALAGAEAGVAVGFLAGPAGSLLGACGGAVVGALLAGASGCRIGSAFGEEVDRYLVDDWRCLHCDRTFASVDADL